ncbi:MAG: hypothetical protein HZB68_01110 [Candidatus Aenigmarchaeota archaeon]|nr:hypothetical protein [Candidatus Aenigmarchaeota archaeon]
MGYDEYSEKKGFKKRIGDWYQNLGDGYFADFTEGFAEGTDPMSMIEWGYQTFYKSNPAYESVTNGGIINKDYSGRVSRKGGSMKKKGARMGVHWAGRVLGLNTGLWTFGVPFAVNAGMNGARMLKKKLKK